MVQYLASQSMNESRLGKAISPTVPHEEFVTPRAIFFIMVVSTHMDYYAHEHSSLYIVLLTFLLDGDK